MKKTFVILMLVALITSFSFASPEGDLRIANQVYLVVKQRVKQNLLTPTYKPCASYFSLTANKIDPKEKLDLTNIQGVSNLVKKYIFRQNMSLEEFSKAPEICTRMVQDLFQEPEVKALFMQKMIEIETQKQIERAQQNADNTSQTTSTK